MRRTIRIIAATIGITLTFVLGGVLGARPAGATYCIQLDVITAQSDDGSTSGSGDTLDTDSTSGLALDPGNVAGRVIVNPPDPYYSELCLPFGKPKVMINP